MGISGVQDYLQSIKPSVVYLWNNFKRSDANMFVSDKRDPTWSIMFWASPIQPPLKNCDGYSAGGKRGKKCGQVKIISRSHQ